MSERRHLLWEPNALRGKNCRQEKQWIFSHILMFCIGTLQMCFPIWFLNFWKNITILSWRTHSYYVIFFSDICRKGYLSFILCIFLLWVFHYFLKKELSTLYSRRTKKLCVNLIHSYIFIVSAPFQLEIITTFPSSAAFSVFLVYSSSLELNVISY